ncbi:unnamed protein product [Allacma fusca]|uniref:F-box domain-containing protein n=1 Tax=Allacma fusca TaxID=39272 RepID=A0A8J2L6H2_9HEXA|nr:unnamed protein product [Allacma fusca]
MEQVFTVDLILKEIIANLEFKDLLSVSQLNKKWNYIARKRLYDNHKCLVTITNHQRLRMERPCEKMKTLDNLISKCVNIPWNGLILRIDDHEYFEDDSSDFHYCIPQDTTVTKNLYPSIWTKLRIKYLIVSCDFKCPAGEIVKQIMLQKGDSIEYLNIKSLKRRKVFCRENQIVDPGERRFKLGNVKILEIHKNMDLELLSDVLGSAQGVQEINGKVHSNEVSAVLKNNLVCKLKEFYLMHSEEFVRGFGIVVKPIEIDVCLELVRSQPKLRKLVGKYERRNSGCTIDSYCDVLGDLIQSSSDCLEVLEIDQLSLIWISSRRLPEARRVTEIKVGYVDAIDYDTDVTTMAKVNFGRMFPNLQTVVFTQAWGVVSDSNGFIPPGFLDYPIQNVHTGVALVTMTQPLKDRLSNVVLSLFPNAAITIQ